MDKPRQRKPRQSTQKVSREHLLRTVASSCAIEGNQSMASIEHQLQDKSHRFSHISLAL